MTLDDLLDVYETAVAEANKNDVVRWLERGHREGIRAVVEALRDEICNGYAENSARDLANQFNEILASDGVEAAGGSTREDERPNSGVLVRSNTADGLKAPAAAPVRDILGLTEADHRHLQYKHWGIGYCDCKACKDAAR